MGPDVRGNELLSADALYPLLEGFSAALQELLGGHASRLGYAPIGGTVRQRALVFNGPPAPLIPGPLLSLVLEHNLGHDHGDALEGGALAPDTPLELLPLCGRPGERHCDDAVTHLLEPVEA